MEPTKEELLEAKRQIDSTIHKLKETVKTLEAKENAAKLKSQLTLAKRRVKAFEIAAYQTELQSVLVAEVTLRYQIDGQWREEQLGPERGYIGFYEGEQRIVQYGKHGIVHFKRGLRDDSPNRI